MAEPSFPSSLPFDRLRVGDCVIDVPLREILAPGARRPRRRVTPKAMGVLIALVEQRGRVMRRDELLARVWPDTLPTDDVLTQAITQLRKAFDDERGHPRYIETITKNGYRLLASVRLPEEAGTSMNLAGTERPGLIPPRESVARLRLAFPASRVAIRGDGRSLATAVLIASLTVVLTVGWSVYRAQPPLAPGVVALGKTTQMYPASTPGAECASVPRPDSALTVFAGVPAQRRTGHTAIMVQAGDRATPRQLSRPAADAQDSAPVWSPDGREIAFLRIVQGKECRVLVMPATGGPERSVGTCDPDHPPSFDWTHDGRSLVFGSRDIPAGSFGLERQLKSTAAP